MNVAGGPNPGKSFVRLTTQLIQNVTKFFDEHPGGGDMFLDVAGKGW